MPEDKAQDNFTDPQSRIMKTADGFQQGYNAQAAVDEDSHVIVATGLTDCAADVHQLLPMIEATMRNTGTAPAMTLADSGYASEDNFAALEAKHLTACVALAREGKTIRPIDPQRHPATQRMAERLATPEGKDHYRRRKFIPEPVFGWAKQALGFRQFSVRGRDAVEPGVSGAQFATDAAAGMGAGVTSQGRNAPSAACQHPRSASMQPVPGARHIHHRPAIAGMLKSRSADIFSRLGS